MLFPVLRIVGCKLKSLLCRRRWRLIHSIRMTTMWVTVMDVHGRKAIERLFYLAVLPLTQGSPVSSQTSLILGVVHLCMAGQVYCIRLHRRGDFPTPRLTIQNIVVHVLLAVVL